MIGKLSTAEAVFLHLKNAIANGALKPGDALPSERELQAELGVSRISLREGLARLSALGLIVVSHGKGTVVSSEIRMESVEDALLPLSFSSDGQSLEELYAARIVIECELAALAAINRTEEQVGALQKNLERMREALEDEEVFVELDLEFHSLIQEAAGNRFLSLMRRAIALPVAQLVERHDASFEQRLEVLKRHERVIGAIRAENTGEARVLARKHLLESKA